MKGCVESQLKRLRQIFLGDRIPSLFYWLFNEQVEQE